MEDQNFKNHAKLVTGFHFVALPLILLIVVGSIINMVHANQQNLLAAVLLVAISIVILLVAFFAIIFALKAQDKAIRADENLRYFIATGKPLNKEISMSQIVALRFAGEDEFVALVQKAANENMSSKQIKMAIQNWKADHNRA